LDYFGDRRTDLSVGKTFQGVETPSQVKKSHNFAIKFTVQNNYVMLVNG